MVDYMNARGTCPDCGEFRGWADGPPHVCARQKNNGWTDTPSYDGSVIIRRNSEVYVTKAGGSLEFDYTNYKGEESHRRVQCVRIGFDSVPWHPQPQWLMLAFDLEKQQHRWFAIKDMTNVKRIVP